MSSHRRIFTLLVLLAVVSSVSLVFGTEPQVTTVNGKVTLKQADGTVKVNGTSAISGATVFSDSTVTTAKGSSAVVSLGKLGRVEVLPETTMKLTFTDSSFIVDVRRGRVMIATEVDARTNAEGSATPQGQLTAVGKVTVNGQSAISGATVFSDSTVTTAKGSSAVVSLGKLGRVEVMPDTTMNLKFDGSGMTAMLEAGRVRVSSGGF